MATDLTKGKPDRVLWKYSLPLFGSIVFQQMYNIADSVVAGKFVGENALAAVGNSYEITLIYLSFAFGLNIGASVVTARLFGARRYGQVKTAVNTAFALCIAVCLVLMALGFVFSPALIQAIQTPAEVFDDTLLYLNIYTGGLLFLFLYNISTGIFASLGDSRTPFIFLAASSVSNIVLDVVFVTVLHMGVAGVAWATFLCQGVSCVLAVVALLRSLARLPHEEADKPRLFSGKILRSLVAIAVPSTLQQCFVSVGNLLIQSIVNGFGTSVMAGFAAAIKFNNFAITSFTTLGNGMSNFTAQNLGAGEPKRVREGYRGCLKMMVLIVTVFAAVYMLLGEQVIRLFLNAGNTRAMEVGKQFLLIVSPFYYAVAIKLASDGVLRGAGRMGEFMIDTFTDLFIRVVLAFVLAGPFGVTGVWLSWPLGWVLSMLMAIVFYRKGKWQTTPQA